jgi:hypothetical protein
VLSIAIRKALLATMVRMIFVSTVVEGKAGEKNFVDSAEADALVTITSRLQQKDIDELVMQMRMYQWRHKQILCSRSDVAADRTLSSLREYTRLDNV